ncbi:MAG: hypothetical protein AB1405_18665 [Bdellovibrionota bacterium]
MKHPEPKLFPAILVLFLCALGACGTKPPALALTRIENERMDVVLFQQQDVTSDGAILAEVSPLAPFAFEPLWNPAHRWLAFTRIDLVAGGQRVLALYDREGKKARDVAAMTPAHWSGYGFTPSWHPSGQAIAFKVRSERDSGVYAAILAGERIVQILPDPNFQIRELCWGEAGLFFTVEIPDEGWDLRWVKLPPPSDLAAPDPLRLAGSSVSLGQGLRPVAFGGALYYVRPREKGLAFDLVRDPLKGAGGAGLEVLATNVGPYFDISSDGVIAYQSDSSGGTRPVEIALLRPGKKEPEAAAVSAFRFCFSPDGKKLAGLWLVAGTPRYFLYDIKSRRAVEIGALRGDLSANALAQLMDRPLLDW